MVEPHARARIRVATCGLVLVLAGCFKDAASEEETDEAACEAGREDCRCLDNATCFGMLACVQGICLPPDPGTSSVSTSEGSQTSDGTMTSAETGGSVTGTNGTTAAGGGTTDTGTTGGTGTTTGGLSDCMGTIDFDDQVVAVLGTQATIGGVEFTANNGSDLEIDDPGGGWGFDSRWLFMQTYGTGVKLRFAAPVGEIHFDAGGPDAVQSTTMVRILSGGQTLQVVDTVKNDVVPVDIVLARPTDEIDIVHEGGSSSTFGIDNLAFDCP